MNSFPHFPISLAPSFRSEMQLTHFLLLLKAKRIFYLFTQYWVSQELQSAVVFICNSVVSTGGLVPCHYATIHRCLGCQRRVMHLMKSKNFIFAYLYFIKRCEKKLNFFCCMPQSWLGSAATETETL